MNIPLFEKLLPNYHYQLFPPTHNNRQLNAPSPGGILGNGGSRYCWFKQIHLMTLFCLPGSESCSSVGSSSSSLSRPHLPLPASTRPIIPSTPIIHPTADSRGTGHQDMIKSIPSQPPPVNESTNYYLLPLDASGIPPGSVLVNPHTG